RVFRQTVPKGTTPERYDDGGRLAPPSRLPARGHVQQARKKQGGTGSLEPAPPLAPADVLRPTFGLPVAMEYAGTSAGGLEKERLGAADTT
ncbi:MAG TPA: hypothetical protein VGE95_01890, partial [Arthrobacter sp.]